jgi:hypothetical protein
MRKSRFFVPVLSIVGAVAFAGFAFYFFETFTADQRTLATELNQHALTHGAARFQEEMETRISEIQVFAARVFEASPNPARKEDFFAGVRPQLKDEIAAVTFFKRADSRIDVFRQYRNQRIFKKRHIGNEALTSLYQARPIPLNEFYAKKVTLFMNRSLRTAGKKGDVDLNLLTLVMDGSIVSGAPPDTAIAVDLVADFLRPVLRESKVTDLYAVFSDGRIFCHPDPRIMREHAERPLSHPIVARLQGGLSPAESYEMSAGERTVYSAGTPTPYRGIFLVADTPKGGTLLVLRTLSRSKPLAAALGLGALALLIWGASGLRKRKRRLAELAASAPAIPVTVDRRAAPVVPKKSRAAKPDPIPHKVDSVAERVLTAQSHAEIYFPGAESPSALAGARQGGERFEFYVGEVRPAELPRPLILDALEIAKGALTEAAARSLSPGDTLSLCNKKLHAVFRGRLFMTMAFGQLDLVTGRLEVASAGHPPALRLKPVSPDASSTDKEAKRKIEALLARGERLGTKAEIGYPSVMYQLEPGDRVLAFTQGTVEAKNRTAQPWGTEGLAAAFVAAAESGTGMARLASGLEAHVSGGLPRGDRAIIWLEWKERLAKAAAVESEAAQELERLEPIEAETRQEFLYCRKTDSADQEEAELPKAA